MALDSFLFSFGKKWKEAEIVFVLVCIGIVIEMVMLLATGLISLFMSWVIDEEDFMPFGAWFISTIPASVFITIYLVQGGLI